MSAASAQARERGLACCLPSGLVCLRALPDGARLHKRWPAQGGPRLAAPATHRTEASSSCRPPLLPRRSIAFRQYRTRLDRSRTAYDLEQRAEFKQQYAATQVLGSTPLA